MTYPKRRPGAMALAEPGGVVTAGYRGLPSASFRIIITARK